MKGIENINKNWLKIWILAMIVLASIVVVAYAQNANASKPTTVTEEKVRPIIVQTTGSIGDHGKTDFTLNVTDELKRVCPEDKCVAELDLNIEIGCSTTADTCISPRVDLSVCITSEICGDISALPHRVELFERTTTFSYDSPNRLISTTDILAHVSGTPNSPIRITGYGYAKLDP